MHKGTKAFTKLNKTKKEISAMNDILKPKKSITSSLQSSEALQVPTKPSPPNYPPTFAHQGDISGGSGCTHVQAWLPNGAAAI